MKTTTGNKLTFLIAVFAGLAVLVPAASHAAVIIGSYTGNVGDTTYNLTASGNLDWVVWNNSTGANPVANGDPTNSMASASFIGSLYPVALTGATGNLRSTSSTPRTAFNFVYNNGTAPSSGTETDAMGLFNTRLDTVGAGVGLDFILPSLSTYQLTIWISGYATTNATFSASLAGATTYSDSSFSSPILERVGSFYTLTVTPDAANDVLSIRFLNNSITGNNSHVILTAAALSVIPEPSTVTSAALGLGVLAFIAFAKTRNSKRFKQQ